MLEDFFLRASANAFLFNKYLDMVIQNPNIGVIYLKVGGWHRKKISEMTINTNNDLVDGALFDDKKYMCNLQAAIWKKDVLVPILANDMDPWKFEIASYDLYKNFLENYKFYFYKKSNYGEISSNDILPYTVAHDQGYGVIQGRVLWKNKKLFKKNKIEFKVKKLPKYSYFDYLKDFYLRHIK